MPTRPVFAHGKRGWGPARSARGGGGGAPTDSLRRGGGLLQTPEETVEGELAQAIECNCSHCSRKGYLLWFMPREQLKLSTPESELSTYRFNKHVINHHFCASCGCAPFASGTDPQSQATAAVNVRCLEGVDLTALKRMPFDGRSR
jgi:hypothetical protein